MSTQISLKLSEKMFTSANHHVDLYGYDTLQDFIRELIREKLFEKNNESHEELHSRETALASEKSLRKLWLSEEEDKAWAHLQN